MPGGERWWIRLVTLVVVGLVAWPALWPLVGRPAADSFPLSTYPMFAHDRGEMVEVATVVGIAHGEIRRLSPELIAGTDQVMLAATAVQRAVAGTAGGPRALCIEVAGRVDDPAVRRIEVVVERYEVERWPRASEPLERRLVASCDADS